MDMGPMGGAAGPGTGIGIGIGPVGIGIGGGKGNEAIVGIGDARGTDGTGAGKTKGGIKPLNGVHGGLGGDEEAPCHVEGGAGGPGGITGGAGDGPGGIFGRQP